MDRGTGRAELLRALPYAGTVPVSEAEGEPRTGVTVYDRDRVYPGHSLFAPYKIGGAFLIEMDGRVAHQWRQPAHLTGHFQHVELAANGDLLAIAKERYLVRMDAESNVRWILEARFHHDLDEAADGRLYAIGRSDALVEIHGVEVPILDDWIAVISAEGELLRRLSLAAVLGDLLPPERIDYLREWGRQRRLYRKLRRARQEKRRIGPGQWGDVFHTNTVEVIERSIPGVCRPGDLLISVRNLDLVAVIDASGERLIWSWGPGQLRGQHHPTLLDDGRMLIFDNGRGRRRHSRVIELDPIARRIVWEYSDPRSFYSPSRSGSQRLPNGNTLITESDNGRVFEVTGEGDTVWEFYAPLRERPNGSVGRAAIYRMERILDRKRLPAGIR